MQNGLIGKIVIILLVLIFTVGCKHDLDISPDGKKIVYMGKSRGKPQGLFIMDIDGNNKKPLSEHNRFGIGCEFFPTFSPDGYKIAFIRLEQKRDRKSVV